MKVYILIIVVEAEVPIKLEEETTMIANILGTPIVGSEETLTLHISRDAQAPPLPREEIGKDEIQRKKMKQRLR